MKPVKNLRQLQDVWEGHFPDVPWNSQKIFVAVDSKFPSVAFEFIFEAVSNLPNIEFDWKSDQEPARADPQFETTLATDGIGLLVRLLNFDSSQIRGFFIRQVSPIQHANVVCLQKVHQTDDWIVVYNSFDRCKLLQGNVISATVNHTTLRAWIGALLNRDLRMAEAMMESDESLHQVIVKQAWIAPRFNLEHVLHGLKKTFRYWTEDEKQIYLSEAVAVIDALRPLSANACLFGGAALGWAREGKLLNHDDDLDVVVCLDKKLFPDLAIALEAVTQTLTAAGWEIAATFFAQLWVTTKSKVAPTLDVFIGLQEENGISCYPMPREALKKNQMFPAESRPLHGVQVPMPKVLKHYFEVDYGLQWQTPLHNYSIEWDRSPYVDLAGCRKSPPTSTRREMAFLRKLAWIV